MNVSFDFAILNDMIYGSPDEVILKLFLYGGWIPVAWVFLWGALELWKNYVGNQFYAQQSFTLLAIDIPRGNTESMRSVENLFTYLAGAHGSTNILDEYWTGKFQLGFSFEIVSIGGYTQFLIYTPKGMRNLVESAVYSVYPDAEISEVNDYTDTVPSKYPDSEYDLWGSEFVYVAPDAYPIKTYPEFHDATSKSEVAFKDPLASLMDLCASLRDGEQLWYQILVKPIGPEWVARCDEEISKIMKEKVAKKASGAEKIFGFIHDSIASIAGIIGQLFGIEPGAAEPAKEEAPLKMMDLKPKQKKQIEAIQKKASKVGFECKIRVIYVARKEVMNKPKVVNGFVGYIKQFIDMDLNNFKPDMAKTATSVNFLFKDQRLSARQNNIIGGYKSRSGSTGRSMKVFNVEELATLWHFPIEAVVKAPLIQKAPGRKSEPPMSLPLEEAYVPSIEQKQERSALFASEVLGTAEKQPANREVSPSQTGNTSLPEFFDPEEETQNSQGAQRQEPPSNLPFA